MAHENNTNELLLPPLNRWFDYIFSAQTHVSMVIYPFVVKILVNNDLSNVHATRNIDRSRRRSNYSTASVCAPATCPDTAKARPGRR